MGYYISKTEALAIVRFECGEWSGLAKTIEKRFDELPSADVVEVVRCRDCKYFEPDGPYDSWCHGWSGMTVDDGYCSFGERKDGDTDDRT